MSRMVASIACALLLTFLPLPAEAEPTAADEGVLLQQLDSGVTAEANEAARALGQIGSEKALRRILDRGDAAALGEYGRAGGCAPMTLRVFEPLAIQHFADPLIHLELLHLVWECGGYRTMQFYRLLAADVQQDDGDEFEKRFRREERANILVRTDLHVEPDILELLRTLPPPPPKAARLCIQPLREIEWVNFEALAR